MGDPAGEIKKYVGFREIQGIVQKGVGMKVITGVIQYHDDHHNAPQEVNGLDANNRFLIHNS